MALQIQTTIKRQRRSLRSHPQYPEFKRRLKEFHNKITVEAQNAGFVMSGKYSNAIVDYNLDVELPEKLKRLFNDNVLLADWDCSTLKNTPFTLEQAFKREVRKITRRIKRRVLLPRVLMTKQDIEPLARPAEVVYQAERVVCITDKPTEVKQYPLYKVSCPVCDKTWEQRRSFVPDELCYHVQDGSKVLCDGSIEFNRRTALRFTNTEKSLNRNEQMARDLLDGKINLEQYTQYILRTKGFKNG